MKTAIALALFLLGFTSNGVLAQQPSSAPVVPAAPVPVTSRAASASVGFASEKLTQFSLDFPGGTPQQLVAAIQAALGRPLNAIIPKEYADIQLPALKMNNVNVSQLFEALAQASQRRVAGRGTFVATGSGGGGGMAGGGRGPSMVTISSYGFRAGAPNLSDDTIWYFYAEQPFSTPPNESTAKVCRFYSLTPYLDRHISVDDITTAIETGWKMLGETARPTISFHKDTKLLIAVGEPAKLEIIDAALKALDGPRAAPAAATLPVPARVRTEPAKSAE
jgi:hypothetical protein